MSNTEDIQRHGDFHGVGRINRRPAELLFSVIVPGLPEGGIRGRKDYYLCLTVD